jgi:hypothetical protein
MAMAVRLVAGIYERIEARLIALEQLTRELEHKLKAFEELARQVDALERKVQRVSGGRW